MGSGAKSYMRKSFLIYEEMRKFFPIYEESYMTLHPIPLNFLIYEGNFISFFISVVIVIGYEFHYSSPLLAFPVFLSPLQLITD
jgi:hypothetical protein